MVRRPRPVDTLATFGCAAFVLVLGFTALRGVPQPATPPVGFDAWLSRYTDTVILVWCLLTLLYASGFLAQKRWALVMGLVVNALYLAASVPGLHLFAIAMHTTLAAYCAWRLFSPEVSRTESNPS